MTPAVSLLDVAAEMCRVGAASIPASDVRTALKRRFAGSSILVRDGDGGVLHVAYTSSFRPFVFRFSIPRDLLLPENEPVVRVMLS